MYDDFVLLCIQKRKYILRPLGKNPAKWLDRLRENVDTCGKLLFVTMIVRALDLILYYIYISFKFNYQDGESIGSDGLKTE